MKKILLTICTSVVTTCAVNAQNICHVSADFQTAENYIVFWERPFDSHLYDSVFIYRRLPDTESSFTKIASVPMEGAFSMFKDENSNSIVSTEYKISFLGTDEVETALSAFHRPIILDYDDGEVIWTMYEKEGQSSDTWITSYKCMRDEFNMGIYDIMGSWTPSGGTGTYEWFDENANSQTDYRYQMILEMPDCYVEFVKANINTSRSNIKNQSPNIEAGIKQNKAINFLISPNPASSFVQITVEDYLIGEEYALFDVNGKIVLHGKINQATFDVNIEGQQKGIYHFTIRHNEKMYSKKIVKE